MSSNLFQAFSREIIAQRQADFEVEARRSDLIRSARLARRVERAPSRIPAPASGPVAHPCCAADVG